MMHRILPICILLGLASSCTPKKYTPETLTQKLMEEGSGYHQTEEVGGVKIDITYRPTDLWVYQETDNLVVDAVELDRLRKKYDNYYYFIVGLSKNKKEALHQAGSMEQYSELVQTLSFRMGEYVTLTTSARDTIPTADFMLNRTYGMSDATEILFVFNKEKAKDQKWVQFNLNEFGMGIGNQRFRFERELLDTPPTLDFQLKTAEPLSTNNY